jgi:hypothetical protein
MHVHLRSFKCVLNFYKQSLQYLCQFSEIIKYLFITIGYKIFRIKKKQENDK